MSFIAMHDCNRPLNSMISNDLDEMSRFNFESFTEPKVKVIASSYHTYLPNRVVHSLH